MRICLPRCVTAPLGCQSEGLVEVLVCHALGFRLQIVPLARGHLHEVPADGIDVDPCLTIEVLTSTSQGIDNPKQIVMLKFMFDILLQRICSKSLVKSELVGNCCDHTLVASMLDIELLAASVEELADTVRQYRQLERDILSE